MKIETASTVIEGFQKAIRLSSELSDNGLPSYCWFRGVKDRSFALLPGAYWRSNYQEHDAMVTFIQEGVAFAEVGPITSWDTYCLAQHHGVPTRLLDWTDSFCAAMFFALDGAVSGVTPSVWILRPDKLNDHFIKWLGIMAPENQPELSLWLPREIRRHEVKNVDGFGYDNDFPLAVYAKKSNRRIAAQAGSFTVHGRDSRPLERMIAEDFSDPDRVLARIDFENIDIAEAKDHLDMLGIKRSTIYPDIDNLVKQIGEIYWTAS